eukprot:PhM_4_TR14913/c0_g1_i1/m.13876
MADIDDLKEFLESILPKDESSRGVLLVDMVPCDDPDFPDLVFDVARRRIRGHEKDIEWLREKIVSGNVEAREVSELLVKFGRTLNAPDNPKVDLARPSTVAKPIVEHVHRVIRELQGGIFGAKQWEELATKLRSRLEASETRVKELKQEIRKMKTALSSFLKQRRNDFAGSPRSSDLPFSPMSDQALQASFSEQFAPLVEEEDEMDVDRFIEAATEHMDDMNRETTDLRAKLDDDRKHAFDTLTALKAFQHKLKGTTPRRQSVVSADPGKMLIPTVGSVLDEAQKKIEQQAARLEQLQIQANDASALIEEYKAFRELHTRCDKEIRLLKERIEALCRIIRNYERDIRPPSADKETHVTELMMVEEDLVMRRGGSRRLSSASGESVDFEMREAFTAEPSLMALANQAIQGKKHRWL